MARDWSEYENGENAKPQTQLDRFVALYAEFGIDCIVNADEYGNQIIALGDREASWSGDFVVRRTKSHLVDGYDELCSFVIFGPSGEFLRQAIGR